MARKLLSVMLCCFAAAIFSCTSSNNTSGLNAGNSSYDRNYSQATSSTKQTYGDGSEQSAAEAGDPPLGIMLMSLETGDLYPGEDYIVYAVVDNPRAQEIEYEWSITNGSVNELPESERGRMLALVEDEYKTAQEGVVEAPIEGVEEPQGEEPVEGAEGTPPIDGQETPGKDQKLPPDDAGAPGSVDKADDTDNPQNQENILEPENPLDLLVGGGTGQEQPTGGQAPTEKYTVEYVDEHWEELAGQFLDEIEAAYEPWVQKLLLKQVLAEYELTAEEQTNYDQYFKDLEGEPRASLRPASSSSTINATWQEVRIVAGPDDAEEPDADADEDPGSEDDSLADETYEQIAALADDLASTNPIDATTNVGDASVPVSARGMIDARRSDTSLEAHPRGNMRNEYDTWQEGGGEVRRRTLGGYGEYGDDEEPLTEDLSFEAATFVTDEPYVLWTPRTPGPVTIYLRLTYKGEPLTLARELEVEVTLREPQVELSEDWPDIVREDEYVYLRLEGENIPVFNKGLFTITYDQTKLSFRDAELGEFFDDAPYASLYYAQPDKEVGRVLLAVDSNTELTELGGDAPLIYIKLKAKQDIDDRASTQLAMTLDSSARYILNRNGENVLPLPIERPIYRTATIMPAELLQFELEERPGAAVTQQQASQPKANRVKPAQVGGTNQQTAGGPVSNQQTNTGIGTIQKEQTPVAADPGDSPLAVIADRGAKSVEGDGTEPEVTDPEQPGEEKVVGEPVEDGEEKAEDDTEKPEEELTPTEPDPTEPDPTEPDPTEPDPEDE